MIVLDNNSPGGLACREFVGKSAMMSIYSGNLDVDGVTENL